MTPDPTHFDEEPRMREALERIDVFASKHASLYNAKAQRAMTETEREYCFGLRDAYEEMGAHARAALALAPCTSEGAQERCGGKGLVSCNLDRCLTPTPHTHSCRGCPECPTEERPPDKQVTDDLLDAPDGAVIEDEGWVWERAGDRWRALEPSSCSFPEQSAAASSGSDQSRQLFASPRIGLEAANPAPPIWWDPTGQRGTKRVTNG